jgi:hypothetical protein
MSERREKWFRYFVYWWILGFIWAAVVQGFNPAMVASHTIWGFAPGWQHEVAIWNLALVCILICVLRSGVPLGKTVIPGLCLLFALLGSNHLISVIDNPNAHGFTIVIANFVPLLAVGILLFLTRSLGSTNR